MDIQLEIWPRVEFPMQLVGRLPHQLWFLPHQLQGLPHQFSIGFGVFRLLNDRVDPKLRCNIRVKGFTTLKRPFFAITRKNHQPVSLFAPPTLPKKLHPTDMAMDFSRFT